jgi:outer membrane protein OmpA-like peptidoglycan-associated protein
MSVKLWATAISVGGAAVMAASSGAAQVAVPSADEIADRLLAVQTVEVELPTEASAMTPSVLTPLRDPICETRGQEPEFLVQCAVRVDDVERSGIGRIADAERASNGPRAAAAPRRVVRTIPARPARPRVIDASAAAAVSCSLEDTGDTAAANLCVTFARNSADLTPQSRRALDQLKIALGDRLAGHRVSLEGFTDATGTSEINQRLSQQRALAVQQYLVANGVSADRLSAVGFGASRPISGRDGTHPTNRRVEVRLSS